MISLLSDLVLEGNPLALEKNYKSVVRGFVLSLKKLDGQPCKSGINNASGSYADGYSKKQMANETIEFEGQKNKTSSPINRKNALIKSTNNDENNNNINNQRLLSNNEETIYIDGWSSNLTIGDTSPFIAIQMKSPVPWRNPPSITPRGKKIKRMKEEKNEI